MFSKPEALSRALVKLDTLPSVAIKRTRLPGLISEYIKECEFLFSISYRFGGTFVPSPIKSSSLASTDTWDVIFGTVLYYIHRDDMTSLTKYYKSLPYTWQLLVYYGVNKSIITSIGIPRFLDMLPELYSEDTLISMVLLPETLNDNFSIQNIKRTKSKELMFPVTLYSGYKYQNMNKLYYLLNYGTKVVSNNYSQSTRGEVLSSLGNGRYGVLFTTSKVHGYKSRYKPTIVAVGSIEDTLSAFKGSTVNSLKLYPRYVGEFSTPKELAKHLLSTNNTNNMLLLSKGIISTISFKDEVKIVKVIDYITDEEYSPIGVVCEYNNEFIKVYFSVKSTPLVNGITRKYIRVSLKLYEEEVVKVMFHSVVKDSSVKECALCTKNAIKLSKNNLCFGCVLRLRRNLDIGDIGKASYKGTEFQMYVRNYLVSGDGSETKYELIKGQGVLQLW